MRTGVIYICAFIVLISTAFGDDEDEKHKTLPKRMIARRREVSRSIV